MSLPIVDSAQHIAAYIAIRGEISLAPAIEQLSQTTKQLYLPVLRGARMHFAPWHPEQALLKKDFGLLEPDTPEENWREAKQLDLVLTPLVVFDQHCNRIGQGGGYYDRAFAFRQATSTTKPILLGVAHEEQQEPRLTTENWDVPLDMIATEEALYIRDSSISSSP